MSFGGGFLFLLASVWLLVVCSAKQLEREDTKRVPFKPILDPVDIMLQNARKPFRHGKRTDVSLKSRSVNPESNSDSSPRNANQIGASRLKKTEGEKTNAVWSPAFAYRYRWLPLRKPPFPLFDSVLFNHRLGSKPESDPNQIDFFN